MGGLVREGAELDVDCLVGTAGDAATVGVAEETGLQALVLELDVVAEQERLQLFVGAMGVGGDGAEGVERGLGAGSVSTRETSST